MEQHDIRHDGIILASASPRRRDLLKTAGLRFDVIPSRIEEETFGVSDASDPGEYVRTLAVAKAGDVAESHPDAWVIGADSIVVIGDRILEKPVSVDDARRMLNLLRGNTHQVFTGYAVCRRSAGFLHSDVIITDVIFKSLSDTEIEWYIHTPEPYDKAGAYAIQGLGSFMVRSINGSYTNVVGLPVCEVIECLTRHGAIDRRAADSAQAMVAVCHDNFRTN